MGGFGPGYDLVRLVLCYEVVVWHCIALTAGDVSGGLQSPFWLPFTLMVPMFFTLSGFLVTASAMRLPWRDYMVNRAARILPALFAVVLFAMLVAGPIATSLPVADYFSDRRFWHYGTNLLALPYHQLPGVFEANPYPGAVNGSLWTVRWEIGCYIMMAIMALWGIARRPWVVPLLALIWAAANIVVVNIGLPAMPRAAGVVTGQVFSAGGLLFPYFLGGASIYLFRDRIPYHGGLAAACLLLIAAVSVLLDGQQLQKDPVLLLVMIAPSAYLVSWAGLQKLAVPAPYRGGDYSYGVYLWHMPVLQLIQHFARIEQWWLLLLVGFLPVTLLAAASWHVIESPVLAARRRQTRSKRAASTQPNRARP